MRVRAVLVQGPGRHIVAGLDGDVSDDGDPHVRMGLETK